MPTSSFVDFTAGIRAIGSRTDNAGVDVTDLTFEEDKLVNTILTEGYLTDGAFEVSADSPASMDVIVGSGSAMVDRYVVEGDDPGQHPYIVQLKDANVTVTLDASDASNPRIDELWLVVADASWDAGSLSLPRIGYRKGDAAASPDAPGPDSAWTAAVKLSTITVGAGVTSITAGNIADNRAAATLQDGTGTVWTDGNVGPGSGLDADTLDGAQLATLMASLEVDNATEVAGPVNPGTSYSNVASVTLSIPAAWGSWKCEAYATFNHGQSGAGQPPFRQYLIRIDGSDQQEASFNPEEGTYFGSVGGRRTGMTTTGSRTVSLRSKVFSTAESPRISEIYLYARAVRTS